MDNIVCIPFIFDIVKDINILEIFLFISNFGNDIMDSSEIVTDDTVKTDEVTWI